MQQQGVVSDVAREMALTLVQQHQGPITPAIASGIADTSFTLAEAFVNTGRKRGHWTDGLTPAQQRQAERMVESTGNARQTASSGTKGGSVGRAPRKPAAATAPKRSHKARPKTEAVGAPP